jgi:NAD(P)-dependent dehydrogenase (short-subunit alcohol dehydrogenase family)
MADKLLNQVAWISGAASAIGEAVARLFAQEGAAVAFADVQAARGGATKTPDREATLDSRVRRVPIGVPLKPAEIAKAVLYLSCEDSAGVTGTSPVIDGGYLAAAEWEHPGRTRFMEQ